MKYLDYFHRRCPKPTQENTPAKPLPGIEHLMESRTPPLLVLPQSKLVENTTKFIQSKIDSENFSKEWLCPQNLVLSLARVLGDAESCVPGCINLSLDS